MPVAERLRPARLCNRKSTATAAATGQTRLFAGNDSGLGHIAAATGTPTITLFGPGDPARYHPWHPQARWIQSNTGNIEDITVDSVMEEVLAVPGT